ncbi:hypothetical protein An02g02140 [Aspergillus niger]|uniref:Uncharacterized protein n=2 Tax=Aspergillus niger TaxID=5061 RepID=A2QC35_ASPNC|nr:hypothetical protein An02g02140 [Aspergillus niger]CAK37516.1 hypothetical protein An02g02140 [Aspergillus niger]
MGSVRLSPPLISKDLRDASLVFSSHLFVPRPSPHHPEGNLRQFRFQERQKSEKVFFSLRPALLARSYPVPVTDICHPTYPPREVKTAPSDGSWFPIGCQKHSSTPTFRGFTLRRWILIADSKLFVASSSSGLTATSCRHSFCLGELAISATPSNWLTRRRTVFW